MGLLIAIGNKKTLDLEDVLQLCPSDSVFRAFPTFKNKLEAECGTINGVTTLKLTKALIFLVWNEILLTAFLVIMNTLASMLDHILLILLFNTSMGDGTSKMKAMFWFQCFLLQNLWNASHRGTGSLGFSGLEFGSDQY